MNESFVEEENTIYEIDSSCKVMALQRQRRGGVRAVEKSKGSQSFKKGCSFPKCVLLVYLLNLSRSSKKAG